MGWVGMAWDGMGWDVHPCPGTSVAMGAWPWLRACAKDQAAAGVSDRIPRRPRSSLLSPSLPSWGPGAAPSGEGCGHGHRSRCTAPGAAAQAEVAGAPHRGRRRGGDGLPVPARGR